MAAKPAHVAELKEPREAQGCDELVLPSNLKMLRWRGVSELTGLSRGAIYRAVKVDGFPEPVKIGPAADLETKTVSVAWMEHEVRDWLVRKIRASRARA